MSKAAREQGRQQGSERMQFLIEEKQPSGAVWRSSIPTNNPILQDQGTPESRQIQPKSCGQQPEQSWSGQLTVPFDGTHLRHWPTSSKAAPDSLATFD